MNFNNTAPYLGVLAMVGIFLLANFLEKSKTSDFLLLSYSKVLKRDSRLSFYTNQGYDLLLLIPDPGMVGGSFSVWSYPEKPDGRPAPLFKYTFDRDCSGPCYKVPDVHRGAAAEYTQLLPIKSVAILRSSRPYPFTISFADDGIALVNAPTPKRLAQRIMQRTIGPSTLEWSIWRTALSAQETFLWCTNRHQLVDHKTGRILTAVIPSSDFLCNIKYLVIHPDMPKALVPIFAMLSSPQRTDSD